MKIKFLGETSTQVMLIYLCDDWEQGKLKESRPEDERGKCKSHFGAQYFFLNLVFQ